MDQVCHFSVDLLILLSGRRDAEHIVLSDLDIVHHPVPDVYLFMDALKISDVIEESVVKHLNQKFHKCKHFVLMWW